MAAGSTSSNYQSKKLSLLRDERPGAPLSDSTSCLFTFKITPSLPVSCSLVPICFVMLPLKVNNYACGRNNFNRLTLSPRTHSHTFRPVPSHLRDTFNYTTLQDSEGKGGTSKWPEGGASFSCHLSSSKGLCCLPYYFNQFQLLQEALMGSGAKHAGSTCR